MSKLETLDKANVQRLVDNISHRNQKLDVEESALETTLIGLTGFFAKETPLKETVEIDGKQVEQEIKIPYQFQLKNHAEFKKFTLPISRSLWAFTKVVSHMRQELYQHETPMPNLTSSLPTLGDGSKTKDILNMFKDISKKLYRDPNSPYNATKELMEYYSQIPPQWFNMIHIFELSIRTRPRINTRVQLDKILNDIVIVFNAHIEPNLVSVVHYANIILKTETEDRIVNLLTTYNQIAERHEKLMMNQPQPQTF